MRLPRLIPDPTIRPDYPADTDYPADISKRRDHAGEGNKEQTVRNAI
jgi:hypothetical protein